MVGQSFSSFSEHLAGHRCRHRVFAATTQSSRDADPVPTPPRTCCEWKFDGLVVAGSAVRPAQRVGDDQMGRRRLRLATAVVERSATGDRHRRVRDWARRRGAEQLNSRGWRRCRVSRRLRLVAGFVDYVSSRRRPLQSLQRHFRFVSLPATPRTLGQCVIS